MEIVLKMTDRMNNLDEQLSFLNDLREKLSNLKKDK